MVSDAFAPLVGQTRAVELLSRAVEQNRIAPAYLFAGPDGVGRSLAARCFAECIFATKASADVARSQALHRRLQQQNHPDLLWVEPTYLHQGQRLTAAEALEKGLKRKAPPQIRLEQIREITQFLSRNALEAPRLMVVVEQAETMAEAAANGLLKTLEEPGEATLILLAPAVENLLPTIVSRCQRIPFRRLSAEAMAQVLTQAGREVILTSPEILALAQGSPGAAIAHWEQLKAIPAELLEATARPPASLRAALELAQQIDRELDTAGQLWLVDYLQYCFWQHHLDGHFVDIPLQLLEKARKALLSYVQPRLVWEVTLMKINTNFNATNRSR